MSDIDSIDIFREGQDQLSASDLNLLVSFIKAIKRGVIGIAPIKVNFSEGFGFSISFEGQDEHTDFTVDKIDTISETGILVPEFGGSTGLDSDGNVFGRTPAQTYTGSRWTFINQGGTADGSGDVDTITSVMDTSKPFIATVSATVVSGDYVGVKTGESILQKDFPGFRVLADTSGLTGGTTALVVRRPVDGMLAKTSAVIAGDASGNVKLSLTDGTTKTVDFSAFNIGDATGSGDLIQLGEDASGSVFFKPPGAVCGNGDCPDSCDPTTFCFEVSWAQGMATGSFFIQVAINRECMGFNDAVTDPNGSGSVTDPTTSRVWDLDVTWDLCLQSAFYIATDCANLPVNWEAGQEPINMGGTCPNQITITAINPVSGTCSGANTFPCCDVSEGCTCL